jgi:hypothetical protein
MTSQSTKNFKYLRCTYNRRPYLGMAYGLSGVLYMLLKATQCVKRLRETKELMEVLENSIDLLLVAIKRSGGRLPTIQSNRKPIFVVDANCGISGIIPLLTEAIFLFPHKQQVFMEAALEAGELTWKEGIRVKGGSLGQGISGNGYMLHTLYRCFKRLDQQTKKKPETKEQDIIKLADLGIDKQAFLEQRNTTAETEKPAKKEPVQRSYLGDLAIKWRVRSFMYARVLFDAEVNK